MTTAPPDPDPNDHRSRPGRVLIIAGSDSGGGAGIQADIKAVTMLGGYATTAVTAITVQNTLGVSDIHPVPQPIISAQIRAVMDDIGADAIKTGMLGDIGTVCLIADLLQAWPDIPVVVDPVMVAKGGARLLDDAAVSIIRDRLLPRAALLTPNVPEAEALTGHVISELNDLRRAGSALLELGAGAVLMKGGHLTSDPVQDLLIWSGGELQFSAPRTRSRHTHGTGCTLASACAAGLASGIGLPDAVARAHSYVQGAIRHAPGFGRGHGPLDHGWMIRFDRASR